MANKQEYRGLSNPTAKTKPPLVTISAQWPLRAVVLVILAVASISFRYLYGFNVWQAPASKSQSSSEFSWFDILPTKDIVWNECYEKFDCARLDLPLDWQDPSEDLRASIAMIRFNATDREDYKGPVFINPGGPGGSGVWFVKTLATHYQAVVGRNHDIIGFDPRGIGMSRPLIDCWSGYQQNAQIWALQDVPVLDAHPGVLYDAYAQAAALSSQCTLAIGGAKIVSEGISSAEGRVRDAGPGRFVSTTAVARDLLHMMEKLGEEKLKFWGFSYGTVVATMFSAMYPDKVGRIVSDGNVDIRGWIAGTQTHFLDDSETIMTAFYHYCHLAGPKSCEFYADSLEDIRIRLTNLLETIKKKPVVVSAQPFSGYRPAVVSYSSVRRRITASFYRPIQMFPTLARALAALEKGDGRQFFETGMEGNEIPISCEAGPVEQVGLAEGTADAFLAVMCSESAPLLGDADDFQKYVDVLANISETTGVTMAQNFRLKCAEWGIRAKWQYEGPFEGNTAFPILFVANLADNVTPLRSARLNAAGFNGSRILIQDAYGHTSLSTPSRCTAAAINAYFQNGTLPLSESVCKSDIVPFQKSDLGMMRQNGLDFALHSLMKAPVPVQGFSMS